MNHIVPEKDRISDKDMMDKHWVQWQLYCLQQENLMQKMRDVQLWLEWKVHFNDIVIVLQKEFGELALAKYMYSMINDVGIIKRFGKWMQEEMNEFIKK